MDTKEDPYYQLRPLGETPENEICSCSNERALLLRGGIGDNPLACSECNLEVRPEEVGFDQPLAQELAYWCSFHNCFYRLWLDSQEFEDWAAQQLNDPESPVNKRGLEARKSLSLVTPVYYWWFQDVGEEDFVPQKVCPICEDVLTPVGWAFGCDTCKVFIAN